MDEQVLNEEYIAAAGQPSRLSFPSPLRRSVPAPVHRRRAFLCADFSKLIGSGPQSSSVEVESVICPADWRNPVCFARCKVLGRLFPVPFLEARPSGFERPVAIPHYERP